MDFQQSVVNNQLNSVLNGRSPSFNINTYILNNIQVSIEGNSQTQLIILGQVKVVDQSRKYQMQGYQFLNETHNAVVEDEENEELYRGNLVNYLYEGYGCLIDKKKNKEYRGYFSKGIKIGQFNVIDLSSEDKNFQLNLDENGKNKEYNSTSELEEFLKKCDQIMTYQREQVQENYLKALTQPITKYLDVLKDIKDQLQLKTNSLFNFREGFFDLEKLINSLVQTIDNNSNKMTQWKLSEPKYSIEGLENSKILQNYSEKQKFISLNQLNKGRKIKLIYQGTKHGFRASDFHRKCDGKSNTITLIKSNYNKIFGAFTTQSWESSINTISKSDNNAYLFSITNNKKFNIKLPQHAIQCNQSYGPLYGGGFDICIYNNSHTNNNCFSNFGYSYNCSPFQYQSNEAQSYLAGAYQFTVVEIEVFMLL